MKNKFFNLFWRKNNFNENNEEELDSVLLFIVNNIDNIGKYPVAKNINSKFKANKKSNKFLLDLYYMYAAKDKSGVFNSIQNEFFVLKMFILIGVIFVIMITSALPWFAINFNL